MKIKEKLESSPFKKSATTPKNEEIIGYKCKKCNAVIDETTFKYAEENEQYPDLDDCHWDCMCIDEEENFCICDFEEVVFIAKKAIQSYEKEILEMIFKHKGCQESHKIQGRKKDEYFVVSCLLSVIAEIKNLKYFEDLESLEKEIRKENKR